MISRDIVNIMTSLVGWHAQYVTIWGKMASHGDCHHSIITPSIGFTINNDRRIFTWYNGG